MILEPSLHLEQLHRLTRLQTTCVIFLGAISSVLISVQPILLLALMQDGRLTIQQIGHAATTELLGMAIISGVAGAWLKPQQLRLKLVMTVLVAGATNISTLLLHGDGIIIARLVNGCCSGILLWLLLNLLVRSKTPTFLYAIAAATTMLMSFVLATICSRWLIPDFGGKGGYGCLLTLNVLMIIPALLIPNSFVVMPKQEFDRWSPNGLALTSLLTAFSYEAGLTALWIYFVPLAAEMGHVRPAINLAVSCAIGFQILGALAAVVAGRKLNYSVIMATCSVVALLIVLLFSVLEQTLPFILLVSVFGIVWTFAPPYHLSFVIAADPTRRAAIFTIPIQLLGCATGPFLSSLIVSPEHMRGVLLVSGCLFASSLLLLLCGQTILTTRSLNGANKAALTSGHS